MSQRQMKRLMDFAVFICAGICGVTDVWLCINTSFSKYIDSSQEPIILSVLLVAVVIMESILLAEIHSVIMKRIEREE